MRVTSRFAAASPKGRGRLFDEPRRVHGRQIRRNRLPRISAIFADPDRASRRTENKSVAGFIDVQTVPVYEIVRILLGKPLTQGFVNLSRIASAFHNPV